MNSREKQALDRHITGNYGEDQFKGEKELTHWYWYAAQDDELMCDLDSRTLLEIALKRLERVGCFKETCTSSPAEGPILFVDSTFLSQSTNDEHYHLVIKLLEPIPTIERLTWELFLMNHTYRTVQNLFRMIDGIPSPSLLISPYNWLESQVLTGNGTRFWRSHDATCFCKHGIHKNPRTILKCPAHIKLRGEK